MALKVGVADVAKHAPATVGVYTIDKECCPKQVPMKGESNLVFISHWYPFDSVQLNEDLGGLNQHFTLKTL